MALYLIVAVADLLIGLFALTRKYTAAIGTLVLVCFSASLWSFELFLLGYIDDLETLYPWFHLTRLGMFLIPPSLALLVWQLLGSRTRLFKQLVILPSFVVCITLYLLNNTVYPTLLRPVESAYLPNIDTIYYVFVAVFVVCLSASIGLSAFCFNSAVKREKQRIQWLLITMVISFVSGGLSLYFMAFDFYLSKFIGATANVTFFLLLLYSTVAHHLIDFRGALSLAVSRILMIGVFCSIYITMVMFLPPITEGATTAIVMALFFMVMLEAYPRIMRRVEPAAKSLLVSGAYDFLNSVDDSKDQLARCQNQRQVIDYLDHLCCKVMKLDSVELMMPKSSNTESGIEFSGCRSGASFKADKDSLLQLSISPLVMVDETSQEIKSQFESMSVGCFFPVVWQDQLMAMVLIGQPSKGSYYRYDDIKLLEGLSSELGKTLNRICIHDHLDRELAEAKKKLSLMSVFNLYNHDIKAPLSIIDGVVSNELFDESKRREIVLEQVAWGSKLITIMTRLLKGNRNRQCQPVDLAAVIEECCLVFKSAIESVELKIDEPLIVDGDENDLKILFINTIKNAVESVTKGKVSLKVSGRINDGVIEISIADNGEGIPPERLHQIWEVEESTKENGSGIGMQAIKSIVNDHEGSVFVTSERGRGTCLHVAFPKGSTCLPG